MIAFDDGKAILTCTLSREHQIPWYHCRVFNFGKPKSAGDWIAHVILGIVALFLIWWMMHMYF